MSGLAATSPAGGVTSLIPLDRIWTLDLDRPNAASFNRRSSVVRPFGLAYAYCVLGGPPRSLRERVRTLICAPLLPATTWTSASDRLKFDRILTTSSAEAPDRSGYWSSAPPLKSME